MTLRVLHLASFRGNVGDSAGHMGLRAALERHVGPCAYTEMELRRFYQNYRGDDRLAWDGAFVDEANRHDLVLVGGGNFWEPWVPGSPTGTTVGIGPDLLARIRTPIVYYGLGFDDYRGAGELPAFRAFLDAALASPRCLLSVRNDGSRANLARLLGRDYAERVAAVPDGAFLLPLALWQTQSFIAVNVSRDKLDESGMDVERVVGEVAAALGAVMSRHPDLDVVFVPHHYGDVEMAGRVMARMDDWHRRTRASVLGYRPDRTGAWDAIETYGRATLALGMRLHANIIPMGQGVPAVGMAVTPKLSGLYGESDIPERCVRIDLTRLAERMEFALGTGLERRERWSADLRTAKAGWQAQSDAFLSRVPALLGQAVAA